MFPVGSFSKEMGEAKDLLRAQGFTLTSFGPRVTFYRGLFCIENPAKKPDDCYNVDLKTWMFIRDLLRAMSDNGIGLKIGKRRGRKPKMVEPELPPVEFEPEADEDKDLDEEPDEVVFEPAVEPEQEEEAEGDEPTY